MKKIIVTAMFVLATGLLSAQTTVSDVLDTIEQNNTTLKALRQTAEAEKLENKTDIYLPDPEIGFNYLWGSLSGIDNRHDISATQSFDIATIAGMKSRVAKEQNKLVEWQYKADRMNILLEAKMYCLDMVYYNALFSELSIRLNHAKTIQASLKNRLDSGDANILEYNNAQMNLATVMGEMSRVETERSAILSQLTRLNGGQQLSFDVNQFAAIDLPLDFNDWYLQAEAKNPVLSYVKQEVELSQKELALNKASWLPNFSAGYMSETVTGQKYKGLTVGMSVPLWSNKNKVKQAKSAKLAAESREYDAKQQFYSQLEILYNRTIGLRDVAANYRTTLSASNNTELLKKALEAGEISMLDYILEIGLYYNVVNQALQAELDYQKAFAELSA